MASRRARLEPLSRTDPQRIGGYVLLGRLGSGAMGRVYLGKSASSRLFAVKTIRSEFADEADFRTRFAHEVAAARRVSGVFTAGVVEADPDAEVPWLATAYIPAPSLDQLVHACGPLPVPALRWLAAGCAEALASIHAAGLVHRDLKPSNVLVSADGPRVIDFGVARATERISFTATHQAVGTPAYMAPEQARDSRQTVSASDVFSLGSTLLFAATGHPPYMGEAVTDVLLRVATEPPDLTGLPDEVADLMTDCLERDPAARPTASALLARLAPELEGAGEYGFSAAPLPDDALALIEEYRQEMRPSAHANSQPAADFTLDSPTSSGEADESMGSVRPAGSVSSSPVGTEDRDRESTKPEKPRASSQEGRVTRIVVISAVAAGVAALLLVLGVVLGRAVGGGPGPSNGRQGGPPGGGPPGPPPEGGSSQPSGKPQIALNQTMGDGNSTFVVHGSGLKPGRKVSIQMDSGQMSPQMPVVDFGGTFNYVINQSHEFYVGKLPVGSHRVTVSVSGVPKMTAAFTVNNL
jgi:serine/threonine protein kinase